MPTFCVHRIITGISTGLNSLLVPLYVRENCPVKIYGLMGFINSFCILGGVGISYITGFFWGNYNYLNSESEINNGTKNRGNTYHDNMWMLAYLLPILTCIIRILFLLFVYKYDTPMGSLLRGRKVDGYK